MANLRVFTGIPVKSLLPSFTGTRYQSGASDGELQLQLTGQAYKVECPITTNLSYFCYSRKCYV
jgi:hypothetical protein